MGKFAKILINTIYTSQNNLSEIFCKNLLQKDLYVFSVTIHILSCLYQKLEISLCLKLIEKYLVFELTVWKFMNFSATQIFREIKSSKSKV